MRINFTLFCRTGGNVFTIYPQRISLYEIRENDRKPEGITMTNPSKGGIRTGLQTSPWIIVGSTVILLPAIAGIAYEFIRFTARHQDNGFIRLITKPNLALQRLTTRPPDQEMLAVAIAAFQEMRAHEMETVTGGEEVTTAKPEATVPV